MPTQTIRESNCDSASQVSTWEGTFDEGKLNRPMTRAALDDARRDLVRNNIGLVHVHMKHYVAPHHIPWTQREWEDLVQEGCLGLIRAAQDFKPESKIPFAAFALPRIHTAIRRVML
jgi:DNA-directed RNA polymerase specialized sigma subunit